ncbi:MAG TPA: tetratricopeptide repeat protein [Candidatus Omnitrophota bacterium]|nr:tetratricopeptide repeat protein [Candidatus Omnitrophota bacterium]
MKRSSAWFCFAALLACFLLSGNSFADERAQKWEEGAGLYKSGKFAESVAVYESLLNVSKPFEKAVLYFNLGNCYYRLGQLNFAILNFERAISLRPWYADARYNLAAAKAKLEYKIEDKRGVFIRLNSLFLQWVNASDFILLALLSLLVLSVSVLFWARASQSSSFWTFPRTEMVFLSVLFIVLWSSKLFYERNYQEGIVIAKEAEVRYGPSLDNQSLMKLGGGLKVFIVDERDDWSRVVTWNGETGWIRNSEIGKVRT